MEPTSQPEKTHIVLTIEVDAVAFYEDTCVPDAELARLNAAKHPKRRNPTGPANGDSPAASQTEQSGTGDEALPPSEPHSG
jgi:hypothetical protein